MLYTINLLSWSCLIALTSLVLSIPLPEEEETLMIKMPLHKRPRSLTRRHNNEATKLFNDKWEFYADIQVGTPPQTFSIVMDTGSDEFWVQSISCGADLCPYKRYDPSKSSTAIDSGLPLNISYMDGGQAVGTFYYDTVTLAGATLEHQLVGASQTNGNLGNGNNVPKATPEGLMGFSFPTSIDKSKSTNFVFSLMAEMKIKEPIFSFYFGDISKTGYETGAELALGGIDTSRYTGNIKYVPVVPDSDSGTFYFWQSYAQGLRVVGENKEVLTTALDTSIEELIPAIMDSGTTTGYVNTVVSKALYSGLTGLKEPEVYVDFNDNSKTYWLVNCAYLDSTKYTIELDLSHNEDPKTIDTAPLTLSIPANAFVSRYDDSHCYWNLESDDESPKLVLGQSFLNYFYTVYNMKSRQIGFASAIKKSSKVEI